MNSIIKESIRVQKMIRSGRRYIIIDMGSSHNDAVNQIGAIKAVKLALESPEIRNNPKLLRQIRENITIKHDESPATIQSYKSILMNDKFTAAHIYAKE